MIFKSIKILTKNWMNGEREKVQKLFHLLSIIFSGKIKNRNFEKKV
jgi:hypothetical protein